MNICAEVEAMSVPATDEILTSSNLGFPSPHFLFVVTFVRGAHVMIHLFQQVFYRPGEIVRVPMEDYDILSKTCPMKPDINDGARPRYHVLHPLGYLSSAHVFHWISHKERFPWFRHTRYWQKFKED